MELFDEMKNNFRSHVYNDVYMYYRHCEKHPVEQLVLRIHFHRVNMGRIRVRPIEALDTNYMYLIIDEERKECAAVDPVNPERV